jgi:hypothetical protein
MENLESNPQREFISERALFRSRAIASRYRTRWGTLYARRSLPPSRAIALCVLTLVFVWLLFRLLSGHVF